LSQKNADEIRTTIKDIISWKYIQFS
jgi:hypothetical protein